MEYEELKSLVQTKRTMDGKYYYLIWQYSQRKVIFKEENGYAFFNSVKNVYVYLKANSDRVCTCLDCNNPDELPF